MQNMRLASGLLAVAALISAPAQAQFSLTPGVATVVEFPGTTSIYQIFGHSGTTDGTANDAPFLQFAAGAGQVFTFAPVTGGVNCCSNPFELNTPDGKGFSPFGSPNTAVTGINGLSSAFGNTQLPLVAVFTSEADPFGQAAPAALPAWDANTPTALAPALHQVFYVGDGRAGFNNASGAVLQFTAPATATRLYLGFADAGSFNGTSGWYQDNPGAMAATVLLSAVPEPSTWALALGGLALVGAAARRRRG